MSKVQLKKYLAQLTKEEVIAILLEVYDVRKEAKEYLDFRLNPNHEAKLKEYKMLIQNEFYPRRGEPKLRFSACRTAISDFKKLNPEAKLLADLMLYYVEMGVSFTVDFGDMWEKYYDTLATNFDKAMKFISDNELVDDFRPRIEKMLAASEICGWGFPDVLYDIYGRY